MLVNSTYCPLVCVKSNTTDAELLTKFLDSYKYLSFTIEKNIILNLGILPESKAIFGLLSLKLAVTSAVSLIFNARYSGVISK